MEAHKGVAAMYVADERFRQYYDREFPGRAKFLRQAVEYWAEINGDGKERAHLKYIKNLSEILIFIV